MGVIITAGIVIVFQLTLGTGVAAAIGAVIGVLGVEIWRRI